MDQKIIDWYSERHFQLHKMVHAGMARGLERSQIESAMVHCWKKIQDGKLIHDIDLARYVFNVAKIIDDSIYIKRLAILTNLQQENNDYKYLAWYYFGVFSLINIVLLIFGSF